MLHTHSRMCAKMGAKHTMMSRTEEKWLRIKKRRNVILTLASYGIVANRLFSTDFADASPHPKKQTRRKKKEGKDVGGGKTENTTKQLSGN